jgi:dihydroorotate oxidase
MGFNNDGADAVARRLARLRSSRRGRACVVGVNIGKNRWVAAEDAAADYATCAGKLARYADYLVVNVSSPNTPGLRDLQAVEALRPIVRATRRAADAAARRHVPVLVKIAPDLADGDVDAVARLVAEEELDGVVATNTTVAHSHGEGGVSGRPVRERALAVVSRLRTALGPHYLVIGVGGVFTVADAEAMISAGADLLETLTGFVYEGPLMPGRINRALARKPA